MINPVGSLHAEGDQSLPAERPAPEDHWAHPTSDLAELVAQVLAQLARASQTTGAVEDVAFILGDSLHDRTALTR